MSRIERLREYRQEHGCSLKEALEAEASQSVATVVFEDPFFELRVVHGNGSVSMRGGLTMSQLQESLRLHLVTP